MKPLLEGIAIGLVLGLWGCSEAVADLVQSWLY